MRMGQVNALIDTVSPEQVGVFLRRKGWSCIDYANPNLLVFGPPEKKHKGLSIVLPSRKEFVDYPAKLRDCIELLASIYEIDPTTVIHNIARWDRDVLEIRLEAVQGNEQLLPLEYASELIAKYRRFVGFAAAAESNPRKFFAKLTSGGRDFAQHCMFGHTFVGSFGLTIECPLGLEADLPLPDLPPQRPFRRAVIERIATGQLDMVDAVREHDPEILVKNHRAGFCGNMCELLADVCGISGRRKICHSIKWASELPPPANLSRDEEPVILDERSYDVLRAASESLQRVEEPDEDKEVFGRITRLKSEIPPVKTQEFRLSARTVVVLWEVERGQPLHINIELPLELYRLACDAHKNGKKIRVFGKPRKEGKLWFLFDQHGFEVT